LLKNKTGFFGDTKSGDDGDVSITHMLSGDEKANARALQSAHVTSGPVTTPAASPVELSDHADTASSLGNVASSGDASLSVGAMNAISAGFPPLPSPEVTPLPLAMTASLLDVKVEFPVPSATMASTAAVGSLDQSNHTVAAVDMALAAQAALAPSFWSSVPLRAPLSGPYVHENGNHGTSSASLSPAISSTEPGSGLDDTQHPESRAKRLRTDTPAMMAVAAVEPPAVVNSVESGASEATPMDARATGDLNGVEQVENPGASQSSHNGQGYSGLDAQPSVSTSS